MRATEKLRKLLDERGMSWSPWDGTTTAWGPRDDPHMAIEDIMGTLQVTGLTPEMAVDATLGMETCHIEGTRIADTLGHDCPEFILYCGECGHGFGYISYGENGNVWTNEPPRYCPNCGARVGIS